MWARTHRVAHFSFVRAFAFAKSRNAAYCRSFSSNVTWCVFIFRVLAVRLCPTGNKSEVIVVSAGDESPGNHLQEPFFEEMKNGGAYGARTRNLRRDRAAL